MGDLSRTFRAVMGGLLTMLAFAAPARAVAQAQTISNVATVHWSTASGEAQASSNRVDLAFAPPGALQLMTPASGLLPQGALQASCMASGVPVGTPSPLAGIALNQVRSAYAGRPVVMSLSDPAANRDAAAVDQFAATVTTSSGDRESATFTETGANTGMFLAVLVTKAALPPVAGDCALSGAPGTLQIDISSGSTLLGSSLISLLSNPSSLFFDSHNGIPVDAVQVTLVDAATGAPATVYGDDGISIFPSTITAGRSVADSGGTVYTFGPGEYRFPLVAAGTYRLQVRPVQPCSAPSAVSAAALATLQRPDGQPFVINSASYEQPFSVAPGDRMRFDVPLDTPTTPLVITKTVDRADAEQGDLLRYQISITNPGRGASGPVTLRDTPPAQMRYHLGSARLAGAKVNDPAPNGRALEFSLPPLAGGARATLSYVLEVRPDAPGGEALNEAQATAPGNISNVADAVVRIRSNLISDRMVITGRVLGGRCDLRVKARGVPGIRVMLEDGSYAVTDADGRYHFEAVTPGTHVVQLDRSTIPQIAEPADCENDVRSGGSGSSRFVQGLGGELKRADFHLVPRNLPIASPALTQVHAAADPSTPRRALPATASRLDADWSGANRDWLAAATPRVGFLFPGTDSNPRSPVTRVVIKHLPGQSVKLLADGRPVDALAFDGTRKSAAGDVAVSIWRGIPLAHRSTVLSAEIRDARGKLVTRVQRTVVFANIAARAELLPERSQLIADGIHRPLVALRITDPGGRPVHQGMTGEFQLPEPYFPAVEADAQQARQLAGLERARPFWHVTGDDGIAYVELEPTSASGTLSMQFQFRNGRTVREQRLDAWLSPGERPWTIVGLAEGSLGFHRISKHLQQLGANDSKALIEGRLALYAKGRILGRWLLTLSYDSAKHRRDQQLGGTIDPQLYYTVYADRSQRRYDAASVRKLYIRLERPQFYALFGDYNIIIDEPKLARYVRSLNGAKAEYRSGRVAAVAFASNTPLTHRRDEIQGNGLSGPYALRSRNLLANSERVTLEVRDRFRSEIIVSDQVLTRHSDYDIDYASGTILLRSPVLSRTSSLDPQFLVVEYDVDGVARSTLNGGARATWSTGDQRAQVGATFVHDNDGRATTNLVGADAKIRISTSTEVRGEIAASRTTGNNIARRSGRAWLIELEHHDGRFDALAYATQEDTDFGIGQTSAVELGTRKLGFDGRWRFNDHLSVTGSAWHQQMLASGAERDAGRLLGEFRRGDMTASLGLTYAHDRLEDGSRTSSTLLDFGATEKFDRGRLELGADGELPLGQVGSIDFPARTRFTLRYAVRRWAALIGSYEIAKGGSVNARTARVGFDLTPWAGMKILLSGNDQNIPEYGRRTFASFGLAQSVILSKNWSADVSLDSNRTIGGIDPASVINRLHPVASGGFTDAGSTLTEDFTAVTAGATYRAGRLSVTGRGEYRDSELERRTGFIFGALRQIGEGRALGGGLNWFRAHNRDGALTSVAEGNLTWANRPSGSPLTWLDKLELRRDSVSNAVAGSPDPLGNLLTVTGNARSLRIINSLALDYSSRDNRFEWSAFWGVRYVSEQFGTDDVGGWSSVVASDFRLAVGHDWEIGAAGSARIGINAHSVSFSTGPELSMRPFKNGSLTIGYNVAGYRDRDFAADRFTRAGPYVAVKLKFDELTFAGLGITRR